MKIYIINTLAELLSLTPAKVRERAKKGEITGYKEGRQWRFTDEDVKAYVEKKKKEQSQCR